MSRAVLSMTMCGCRARAAEGVEPYILVHQAGLADTAVTEDDNLPTSAEYHVSIADLTTLRRTFFLDAIVWTGWVVEM